MVGGKRGLIVRGFSTGSYAMVAMKFLVGDDHASFGLETLEVLSW